MLENKPKGAADLTKHYAVSLQDDMGNRRSRSVFNVHTGVRSLRSPNKS